VPTTQLINDHAGDAFPGNWHASAPRVYVCAEITQHIDYIKLLIFCVKIASYVSHHW